MSQVDAKVIAHSKSSVSGREIITFELEFPRIILAEFNTHNALSKNSSSSRAIPVEKMLKQVRENPAIPVRFGKKNKGMQDAGDWEEGVYIPFIDDSFSPKDAWGIAAKYAALFAEAFEAAGYAKQICNRLIEPFQKMKVVMTATELNNFIWLRDHPAADPTIEALAKAIKKAKEESKPVELNPGEWHVHYYKDGYWRPFVARSNVDHPLLGEGFTLEDALAISVSCCAQVSFRSLDDSLEKAHSIVEKLNLNGQSDEPVHASPTEHQATPIRTSVEWDSDRPWYDGVNNHDTKTWEEGITHLDRDGTLCSGNLKGWIQYRQLVPNNVKCG